MHLGTTPWKLNSSLSAAALCQQAADIEAWGYHSFWLPERHFAGDQSLPEPLLLLAAIAAGTTTLKLATTSYLLPIRNPILAAEQIAVVDQLSEGRLILGLGRGFQKAMLQAFEVDSKHKRDIFDDALAVMKKSWAGEPIGADEKPVQLYPRPTQQPHPPMVMAAFGPKALHQAAKHGLPYLASPVEPLTQLEHNKSLYLAAMNEFEQPEKAEIAVMRTIFVSEDTSLCRYIREQLHTQRLATANNITSGSPPWIVGDANQVVDEIARYRECLGIKTLVATRPAIKNLETHVCKASCHALANLLL